MSLKVNTNISVPPLLMIHSTLTAEFIHGSALLVGHDKHVCRYKLKTISASRVLINSSLWGRKSESLRGSHPTSGVFITACERGGIIFEACRFCERQMLHPRYRCLLPSFAFRGIFFPIRKKPFFYYPPAVSRVRQFLKMFFKIISYKARIRVIRRARSLKFQRIFISYHRR